MSSRKTTSLTFHTISSKCPEPVPASSVLASSLRSSNGREKKKNGVVTRSHVVSRERNSLPDDEAALLLDSGTLAFGPSTIANVLASVNDQAAESKRPTFGSPVTRLKPFKINNSKKLLSDFLIMMKMREEDTSNSNHFVLITNRWLLVDTQDSSSE